MRRGTPCGCVLVLIIALGLLPFGGCARPIQPEAPTAAAASEADLDAIWNAALMVLSRMDLRPDRMDRASGVIETQPTTTQQFFEFWRRDVIDRYAYAEAQMHTMRRKATVRFRRLPESQRWQVEVQVDVERWQAPDRQFTSTSSALAVYSSHLPTTEGERMAQNLAIYWEPAGRDAAMERLILDRILRMSGTVDFEYVEPDSPDDGTAAKKSGAAPAG